MADADAKLPTSIECGNSKRPWRRPEWLDGWPAMELPPVPQAEINRLLAEIDGMLVPSDADAIAVMLLPLGELFGPPRPEAIPRYIETLSDIPTEALAGAVYRCMRECKFFPAPVEIRERADDFHHLHTVKTRLETALWRIDFETRRRG
jgi:hypothetical protein